jgi:predicted DsbA family dithiol-disulfide isomerase
MAESGLDSLRQTREVVVEWRAFELRPGGKFPGAPEQEARYREMIRQKHTQMETYAREQFGLEMKEGPWAVNSRPAHEGSWFARAHGKLDDYNRACFAAHWQQGKRLDDLDTLVAIAESVGLDGPAFREAVAGRTYRVEVEMDLMRAREIGIDGVPAFIFGDRYVVWGSRRAHFLELVVDMCIEVGVTDS